jgi:hypothetical protein
MPPHDGKKRLRPRDHTNSATSRYGQAPPEAKDKIKDRKEKFAALNDFVTKRKGWLVSIPGDRLIDFQCLPESDLPQQLARLGYAVHADGHTERILPAAIIEKFTRNADGSLEPLTEGSTQRVSIVTHAGLTRVARFWFDMG